MAKAARGRKVTATRTPRKKKGAQISIDEPKKLIDSDRFYDESLRERCINLVLSLNAGREMKLKAVIEQAEMIFIFIKYPPTTFSNFGIVFPTPAVSVEDVRNAQDRVEPVPESSDTVPHAPHRSKFEETHAL